MLFQHENNSHILMWTVLTRHEVFAETSKTLPWLKEKEVPTFRENFMGPIIIIAQVITTYLLMCSVLRFSSTTFATGAVTPPLLPLLGRSFVNSFSSTSCLWYGVLALVKRTNVWVSAYSIVYAMLEVSWYVAMGQTYNMAALEPITTGEYIFLNGVGIQTKRCSIGRPYSTLDGLMTM